MVVVRVGHAVQERGIGREGLLLAGQAPGDGRSGAGPGVQGREDALGGQGSKAIAASPAATQPGPPGGDSRSPWAAVQYGTGEQAGS